MTVNVSDVSVALEPGDEGNHILVLSSFDGELRIRGTVEELREAVRRGLSMSIPPLARESAPATPNSTAGLESDRLNRIEETLASLTRIAETAQRRGLI